MWRRWAGVAVVLAGLAAATTAAVRPASAVTDERIVAPGVVFRAFTRADSAGPQEVRVLSFMPGSGLHLRPILAADYGPKRMAVTDMVLASGAVGAVNGDFFTADGDTRGILVENGVLRSEPEAAINGAATPRAAWRVTGDDLQFGRPSSRSTWTTAKGVLGLNGIERATGYLGNPDETVLETSAFGATSATPPGGPEVVLGSLPPLRANVTETATVTEVRDGPGPIPAGGAVLGSSGANAGTVRGLGLQAGDPVDVRIDVDDPGFASAEWAGGGGPWILQNGQVMPRDAMLGEGFAPSHVDPRAPRTALGRASDGTVLLVTVDGRQPKRSVGASLAGMAVIMRELGAVDAISMDGGGSTAMSVDGLLENVPSGEDSAGRSGVQSAVSDGIGVFYDFTPVASRRVAGADRVATAIELSHERSSASTVVLATTGGFADALVGGPLAKSLGAPVLLTSPGGLDQPVADEIKRLGATSAVLLGGPTALGPQVEAALSGLGITSLKRLAGNDRYETAAAVAAALPSGDTVLVASGERFPDALAAGTLGLPVLLVQHDAMPAATASAIGSRHPVLVGGTLVVADGVVPGAERVAGADRYATSGLVADWGISHGRFDDSHVLVARGDQFPDALVAGAFGRPLLLVGRSSLDESPATRDWLRSHGSSTQGAVLLGGRLALSLLDHVMVEQAVVAGAQPPTQVGDLVTAP